MRERGPCRRMDHCFFWDGKDRRRFPFSHSPILPPLSSSSSTFNGFLLLMHELLARPPRRRRPS